MCGFSTLENMVRTVVFVRTLDKRVKVEDLNLDSDVALAEAKATVAKNMVDSLTGPKAQLREDIEFMSSLVKVKESLSLDASKDKEFIGALIEEGLQHIRLKYKA